MPWSNCAAASVTEHVFQSHVLQSCNYWVHRAQLLKPTCPRACACRRAKSLQSCRTLCDPRNCSLPGSSVHGILQATIPEWVAMPFSRGSSPTRDQTHVSYVSCTGRRSLHHWGHLGSSQSLCSITIETTAMRRVHTSSRQWLPFSATRESPWAATKTQYSQK